MIRFLDRLIHSELLRGPSRRPARALVFISLITQPCALITAIEHWFHKDSPLVAAIITAMAVLVLLTVVVLNVTRSYKVAFHYVGTVTWVGLLGVAWFRGGFFPAIELWLVFVPIGAFFMGLERRVIGLWAGLMVAHMVLVLGLQQAGLLPPIVESTGGGVIGTILIALILVAFSGNSELLRQRAIEQREALQRQLYASRKLESLGQLAGGVAHDFNNILAVIAARTSVARDLARHDPQLVEDIEAIEAATRRGTGLTRQLLAFARRDLGPALPIDVNDTVSSVARLVRPILGTRIDLKLNLQAGLPAIAGDRLLVEQLVMNLVINARDALADGDGGRITIRTHALHLEGDDELADGTYIALAVRDDGPGLSAEARARWAEPFFTTKSHGTGLGLAIVKRIAEDLDGTVRLSEPDGGGAEFAILLPSDPREAIRTASGERARAVFAAARALNVLFVDDDQQVRDTACRVLRTAGHSCLSAADGDEALATLAQHPEIEVVVTDLVMPGLSGHDLATRLASTHPHVLVVFISGDPTTSGDDEVIRKPLSPLELLQAIDAQRERH